MGNIIKNYPVFEKNQVLTHTQLNHLVKYLDQQNRLTRTHLIGLGAVCGLELLREQNNQLTITKGVGVTSEGFLIQMGDCVLTHYRNYTLPSSVTYPSFQDPAPAIQLHELLKGSDLEAGDTAQSLTDAFLNDKIVLLFLEVFDKDLKSCLGKSCDELGKERVFKRRELLISEADLLRVMAVTNDQDEVFQGQLDLPGLLMPRPLFDPTSFESKSYYGMGIKYLKNIWNYTDEVFTHLPETYTVFKPLLENIYDSNPFNSSVITSQQQKISKYFQDFIEFSKPVYGVQYLYDFFKDLTLAYNEFRELGLQLNTVCYPDTGLFPRHLMLGQLCTPDDVCHPSKYRHEFMPTRVSVEQNDLVKKMQSLHKRLVLMLECFSFERILEPAKVELKITPSDEKKGRFSHRTIPHYYNSKKASQFPNLGTLEENWSFKNSNEASSAFPKQLSYDNHKMGSYNKYPVTTPLGFDLDQFDFYRIEGVIAKPLKEIETKLQQYKEEANLSFDIKAVYFGHLSDNRNKTVPDCAFSDLQPDYSIWRNKVLLFLNNLVRANQNVEKVMMNRATIFNEAKQGFKREGGSNEKKNGSSEKSGMSMNFEMNNIARMMKEGKVTDFKSAAGEISRVNKNLGNLVPEAEAGRSASFESNQDTSIRGLFKDLNDCMLKLIQSMPVDFKKFKMDDWLLHYKCALRMYIKVMKFLASEVTALPQLLIVFLVLKIMCVLFKVVRFLAVYSYITIRVLVDTAGDRISLFEQSRQFARFLKNHRGLEHKAGLAPGHTFVLVYQANQELKDFEGVIKYLQNSFRKTSENLLGERKFTGDFEFPNPPDPKNLLEVLSSMKEEVVADFTLPFIFCDDCGNMPHTPLPLDPLAPPICGVAQFVTDDKGKDEPLTWDYLPISIRILNDLYDPSVYQIRISKEPSLGDYEFVDVTYDPDNTKKAQLFKYEVDEAKVFNAMGEGIYFLVDEFDYEVVDVSKNDEVVGNDKISIFIPVVPTAEIQTGVVSGMVAASTDNGVSEALPGVTVAMVGSTKAAITDLQGFYKIAGVPVGLQTFEASVPGYQNRTQEIEVKAGENTLNFDLSVVRDFQIDFGRIFKVIEVQPDSDKARKVKGYYSSRMHNYEIRAEKLIEEENSDEMTPIKRARNSVKFYAEESDISIVRMNNDYNHIRNELVEKYDEASGKEKEMYKKSLQNLTGAYLDRLAFAQPKKLSRTTSSTLKETASIFNSRKDLGMKEVVGNWNKSAEGFVPDAYRKNINTEFILR